MTLIRLLMHKKMISHSHKGNDNNQGSKQQKHRCSPRKLFAQEQVPVSFSLLFLHLNSR